MFGIKKDKKEFSTRSVIVEKKEEYGKDFNTALASLIQKDIIPTLMAKMKSAGFSVVHFGNTSWYLSDLEKHQKNNSFQSEHLESYKSFLIWTERANEMIDKIQGFNNEVEEMKRSVNAVTNRVNELRKNT